MPILSVASSRLKWGIRIPQCLKRYTHGVRRLLQFGTLMLLLAAFLTPLIQFFDRWDPPGPGSDTELAVFGLILVLCLVLVVCELIASFGQSIGLTLASRLQQRGRAPSEKLRQIAGILTLHVSPPLRI